jgi:trimeric autotransporter adhesin
MKNITLIIGCSALTLTVFTSQAQIIATVAGNGTVGYYGDGGLATAAELDYPNGLAFDKSGNYYIAGEENYAIRKVNTSGIISTIAGNGIDGYSGDGGQATAAELSYPRMVALDSLGNIYIADNQNNRIRKVDTSTGIITTFAGNGVGGYNGDNIAATTAELHQPNGIGFDKYGNLFIADNNNNRIRMVNTSGIITTIAGIGNGGFYGDGGQATVAEINSPYGLGLDASGNVYFSDLNNYCIREINMGTGIINTIAGIGGVSGYTGDGGQATAAELSASTTGVTFDVNANFYIADPGNSCIRMGEYFRNNINNCRKYSYRLFR